MTMSRLSGFFAKPAFAVQPIGAEWAEDCERLHGASFAFGWSKVDFESYLTDPGVIADGALANGGKLLGGFIMSRLTPPDSEIPPPQLTVYQQSHYHRSEPIIRNF